jgi:RHS repeat-associated protein
MGTINYSYLPGNFLTAAGATTYSYDPNGNLYTRVQGGNTTTYTFDSQDRLTGVSSPSLNFQYQYDGLFNRVSKTDAGTTTKYLVDPNGFLPQVIAEMDAAYNITSYYVYDGIGLVAKMTSSGSTYFYHYNGSGNTIAMTDSSGNMVNKYAYDEFGNLVNVEESVPNPFLFVGQYGVMDDDNGLLYMRARYYDPAVGRFMNKDPIRYWGGINLFAYAANNPINFVDPLGLKCKKGFWERAWENFVMTNEVIPGILSPPLLGTLTAGKMAEALGSTTMLRWALGGFRGATMSGAAFTGLETGTVAAGTALLNYAYVALAWEVGVGIGSMISATIMPCEEEPTPCK